MLEYKNEYILTLPGICQDRLVEFIFTQHKIALKHSNLIKGFWRKEGRRREKKSKTHRHKCLRFGFVQLKLQFLFIVIDSIKSLGPGLRYSALEF